MRKIAIYLNRPLGIAALIGAAVLLNSCKMPPQQAWRQIQSEGLVRYLAADKIENSVQEDSQLASRGATEYLPSDPDSNIAWIEGGADGVNTMAPVQEFRGGAPGRVATMAPRRETLTLQTASPVPGQAGYVYSPHAPGKVVNVKRFGVGDEVRCPHSGRSFLVPQFTGSQGAQVATRTPVPSMPQPRKKLTVNLDRSGAAKPEIVAPRTLQPKPKAEVAQQPAAVKPDGLNATRVPGKPNLVYSPYASKRQIVDVTGLSPGEKARCPYTNRIFVVPGSTKVAAAPKKSEVAKISDDIDFRVLEGEDKKPSTAGGAAPATAAWADKKGYVKSPFGGQLVDVRGKAAGTVVRCPFSGKLFKVPAGSN